MRSGLLAIVDLFVDLVMLIIFYYKTLLSIRYRFKDNRPKFLLKICHTRTIIYIRYHLSISAMFIYL